MAGVQGLLKGPGSIYGGFGSWKLSGGGGGDALWRRKKSFKHSLAYINGDKQKKKHIVVSNLDSAKIQG